MTRVCLSAPYHTGHLTSMFAGSEEVLIISPTTYFLIPENTDMCCSEKTDYTFQTNNISEEENTQIS